MLRNCFEVRYLADAYSKGIVKAYLAGGPRLHLQRADPFMLAREPGLQGRPLPGSLYLNCNQHLLR